MTLLLAALIGAAAALLLVAVIARCLHVAGRFGQHANEALALLDDPGYVAALETHPNVIPLRRK